VSSLIIHTIFSQNFLKRFSFGFLGFIYLTLGFLLFSIIFWSVYLWLVKGKKKNNDHS
jgi:uncharacterized BrkB/YihY/UPF0761 family membrane protein